MGKRSTVVSTLAAEVVSRDDGAVVWLDGEHDIATVSALTDVLASAVSAGDTDLVVDLSGVTFIGAAPVGALIRSLDMLRLQSRTLTVRSPSTFARRVLDLCGFRGLVEPDVRRAADDRALLT
jgi:anti-sigma B factor antagonist